MGAHKLTKRFLITLTICLHLKESLQQGGSPQKSGLPDHPTVTNDDKQFLPAPTGSETKLGNLSIYETIFKPNDKVALIAVYDLFGFHPHLKYVVDKIAEEENGIRVIAPDFFHGKPYDVDTFPPPNFQNDVSELFETNGSWSKSVKQDIADVIQHYKSKGITSFGIFGFCWGGKMSVYAASDPDFKGVINAAGLVHPSKVVSSDSDNAHCPMILLPSKDEPDMLPFLNHLNDLFSTKSEHKRFTDMKHGFAGARSDFENPTVKARVDEAIQLLKSYFRKTLF